MCVCLFVCLCIQEELKRERDKIPNLRKCLPQCHTYVVLSACTLNSLSPSFRPTALHCQRIWTVLFPMFFFGWTGASGLWWEASTCTSSKAVRCPCGFSLLQGFIQNLQLFHALIRSSYMVGEVAELVAAYVRGIATIVHTLLGSGDLRLRVYMNGSTSPFPTYIYIYIYICSFYLSPIFLSHSLLSFFLSFFSSYKHTLSLFRKWRIALTSLFNFNVNNTLHYLSL